MKRQLLREQEREEVVVELPKKEASKEETSKKELSEEEVQELVSGDKRPFSGTIWKDLTAAQKRVRKAWAKEQEGKK